MYLNLSRRRPRARTGRCDHLQHGARLGGRRYAADIVRVAVGETSDARIRVGEATVSPAPADLADQQTYRTSCPGRWRRTSSATICPARAQHHHVHGPYGLFQRPSKTGCPRATLAVHHRPAETRDPSVQKDRRAHTMATHRCMHMNQTVFSNTPHERGALSEPTVLLDSLGIIPACAGSTYPACQSVQLCRDHPRMRGEHKDSLAPAYRCAGSFPHTRGAPAARAAQRVPGGIIPACAGSTRPRPPHTCRPRDYPRMRGEHTSPSWHRPPSPGSSPHVRGAPDLLAAPLVGLGIIPACAGSTCCRPP